MSCNLAYIPERLHSNDRPEIQEFYIGEFLYRRCKEEEKQNPFDSINLYDLSVNRSGIEANPISNTEDVLYNTTGKEGVGEKYDLTYSSMLITELDESRTYKKEITCQSTINGVEEIVSCTIKLAHKKEECNYAHCTFNFYSENIEITSQNYKQTLGKGGIYKRLRKICRHEISKMILKEEVRINWNF